MRETENRGADIVLNSLAGKLLHASWQCVAKFGKMVELGKVDFLTNGTLDMAPFCENRAFFGVDLLQLGDENPVVFSRYGLLACSFLVHLYPFHSDESLGYWPSCSPGSSMERSVSSLG